MFRIVLFLVDLIEQHVVWIYAACAVAILINLLAFLAARRSRRSTIFPVEQEIAVYREGRSLTRIGVVLGVAALVTALRYYVVPTIDVTALVEPTPTVTLNIPTQAPTPTQEPPTPTAEPSPRPTRVTVPTVQSQPTATATSVPPSSCPDPNTCITNPRPGESLSGSVAIRGTANHPQFQFYKIEYGLGGNPDQWHSIGDIVHSPVVDGVLLSFDTRALPNGVYSLRLTVVDVTGNFPPPYELQVTIEN